MGRELNYKGVNELDLYSGTPTSSDMVPILDASDDVVKRVAATKLAVQGGPAFSGVPASGDTMPIYDSSAGEMREVPATRLFFQGATAFSGVPASNDVIPIYDNSGSAYASLDATKVFVQGAASFSGVPAASDVIPIYDASGTAFASLDATKVPVQGATAYSGAPATNDAVLVWDNSASAFRTLDLEDVPVNGTFGTDLNANANLKHHVVTVTLAEINADHELLTGVAGKKIHIFNVIASVSGNFATGTDVRLQDEQGSPIEVLRLETAGLTDQAIIRAGDSNTLIQIGMVTGLTTGDGLVVSKTGSAYTGGTSITFSILYSIQ